MSTLTGQTVGTPTPTYRALLKMSDNGIVTGTLKEITDGYGNSTGLWLSTTVFKVLSTINLPNLTPSTYAYIDASGNLASLPAFYLNPIKSTITGTTFTHAWLIGKSLTNLVILVSGIDLVTAGGDAVSAPDGAGMITFNTDYTGSAIKILFI